MRVFLIYSVFIVLSRKWDMTSHQRSINRRILDTAGHEIEPSILSCRCMLLASHEIVFRVTDTDNREKVAYIYLL